jgi:hypothetical protein
MFIRDIKTLADFATELATLNELLADPKNLKKLSKEVELAGEIITKREAVQKEILANEKLLAEIAKGKAEIEQAKKLADDNLAASELVKSEIQITNKKAEDALRDAELKLKSAATFEAKQATIAKKSEDKAILLEKKLAEVDAKIAVLDDSIAKYNDAVAKLTQVKV